MRATNEEVLAIAQWRKDGVALQFRLKYRKCSNSWWMALGPGHDLDFGVNEYRRKPSEPVIMYAPYQSGLGYSNMSKHLYKSVEDLYRDYDNADVDLKGHVEVKVYLKGDAQ